MNKRYLHHQWRKLRRLSPMVLLLCTLLSGTIYVFAARQNNLQMIKLKEAVFKADESGQDVEKALQALRQHVYAHMNTDLTPGEFPIIPPIQLRNTYNRLVAAEKARVSEINTPLYNIAQTICEAQFPGSLTQSGRIPCQEQYVLNNGAKEQPIPKELYQFDFISPRWSPDFAGWNLVVTSMFGLLLALRLLAGFLRKLLL